MPAIEKLPRFSFGDSPALADELLALVIAGKKTATTWAAVRGDYGTTVGSREVIRDGAGRDRVVIEITELILQTFTQVDASIAHDEGEGDLSLDYWRQAHQVYFTRDGTYAPDMPVYTMRFKVVELL